MSFSEAVRCGDSWFSSDLSLLKVSLPTSTVYSLTSNIYSLMSNIYSLMSNV
ncbi:hypothetical protein HMPREF9999_01093 [Alloprevotella sp. oral taxon 473 str. F0040]|nr:hypothetical protein HMPREF9999_01093 [Alloprevotella sp. oral taxon 473 str. F0040]